MRIFVGIALLGIAAPALACVCSPPTTEAEKREIASRIATTAAAVVQIEQIAPMDYPAMRGETYRVVKVHHGSAPPQFQLARDFHRNPDGSVGMAMTSCDEVPPPGQTTTAVLYATAAPEKFRLGSTCDHLFVNETDGAIDLIRAEAAKLAGAPERG